MKILFVCTGNTCRSPMAEGIFKSLTSDIFTESAGTAGLDGEPASNNAVLACGEIGIDISSHKSRMINETIIDEADLLVAMNGSHMDFLLKLEVNPEKVVLLGEGIPDPYMGDLSVYRSCRDAVKAACEKLLQSLNGERIEGMNESHLNALAEIEKLSFSRPWSRDGLKSELNRDDAYFYTLLANNSPVGYIGMHVVLDEGYIANLAIHPDYRGMGHGKKLLLFLIQKAREHSLSFLSLEVRPSNKAAVRLYESQGFEKEGVRKNFYEAPKEDALIMTKRLVNE